ncbi:MAG TPA: alpha/beta hydrolase [Chloroflexota bacterium]|nr:alpha/beta hydrolase [Chloroflexota bacterium]
MDEGRPAGELTGAGGVPLAWWSSLPPPGPASPEAGGAPGAVRAVTLLVHGYGEHQGRYSGLVRALTGRGLAVYTLDHRGHGRSGGARATVLRFDDFVDDLHLLEQRARAAHPGAPVFVFGHSMGGLVALRFALRYQDELRGLALSAPALRFGERTPAVLRRLGGVVARVAPALPVPGPRPETAGESLLSRDPDVQRAFDADPLNYHGPVRARMGYQMLRAAQEARGRFEALRLPLLVLQGDADRYVVPAGAAELYERASSADKTLKWWPGCRHELLNEPEGPQVQAFLLDWLETRSPAPATSAGAGEGGT